MESEESTLASKLVSVLCALWCMMPVAAQLPDGGEPSRPAPGGAMADSVHSIDEVIVTTRYRYRDVIPSQRMNGEELERLSSHSVADALRFFSGMQVKDYGGVGGLKTINIRSMGTHHVGIYYDGIELGNAQNGQTDLGQFSLDNLDEVTVYNGQRSTISQPAADYASAGTVYMSTRRPSFTPGKPFNVRAKIGYGSSDMLRLSAVWEQRLSDRVSMSVSLGGLTSSGRYKFRYRRKNLDGTVAYDTTATRHNGDVQTLRAEANLYGRLNGGAWDAKVYTYHSERGIPGAIVNNVWRRGERQWDHNTFAQASVTKSLSSCFESSLRAKYAYYDTRYVNRDSTTMLVDNTFHQQELYLSSVNVWKPFRLRADGGADWSVALSYDFKWNKLDADMMDFAFPHRFQNMVAVATAIEYGRLKAQGSLLTTFVKDHVRYGTAQPSRHKLTPALFVSLQPLPTDVFLLRAFVKQSYRMPTFNDLYYTDIGNSDLVPETAIQYNVGATIDKTWQHGLIRNVSLQADAYYNTVHDKIIAYPQGQQFRWTMLNLGRVHIRGLDVAATVTAMPAPDLRVMLRAQYTFQRAIDVTDPDDSFYRDQIPYIPRHSGSAIVNIGWRQWDLNYSFVYSGERYSQKENIKRNYMQPWYTSDVSLTYRALRGLPLGRGLRMPWRVMLAVNNLFSQDYDVVINYPMPKRNYAVTLDITI